MNVAEKAFLRALALVVAVLGAALLHFVAEATPLKESALWIPRYQSRFDWLPDADSRAAVEAAKAVEMARAGGGSRYFYRCPVAGSGIDFL